MPELPEVETVRKGLQALLLGYEITKAQSLHERVLKNTSLLSLAGLKGAKIIGTNRRGKFLWFLLDRPEVLVAHLGMSGQFLLPQKGEAAPKHVRARFEISHGKNNQELVFNDQRTFGWLSVEELIGGVPTSALHIARDPFDSEFNKSETIENYARRRMKIKSALLHQEIMSGVGNIYADETLWRAKVHPETLTNEISLPTLNFIIESAVAVMSEAIAVGGTSFDDLYINVNGESGYFARSLAAYGRTGKPCERCGTPIQRAIVGQRSSHFCPHCQRE